MPARTLLALLPILGLLAACEGLGLPGTMEEALGEPNELNNEGDAGDEGPMLDDPEPVQ